MKKLKKYKFIFLLLTCLVTSICRVAAQEDPVTTTELVKLKYFNENNGVQYLVLENFLKTGNKMEALKNKVFQLYLDSNKNETFIARVTTDRYGKAKSFLPPSLRGMWKASPQHKFIAVSAGKEEAEATTAELEITKAKIQIDTVSEEGSRSITVQVMKYENSKWQPANEVEITVGIQRHGGVLSAGDEATYTTDSSGTVTVELTKDSLPGDARGNLTIVAKVEDNDQYGNLLVEQRVRWGVAVQPGNSFFDQRALWSTRFRTPFWLLFMAYSIVIGVWGTIIYLVLQIVKIKKMGTSTYE